MPYKDPARDRARRQTPEYRKKAAIRTKAWVAANRDRYRAWYRRRAGLPTPTRAEPALCECCGQLPGKKSLAVDHCHETGKFRGWLCTNCNTGIGKLGDGIEGLIRA